MNRNTESVTCYHCNRRFARATITAGAVDSTPECPRCRNTLQAEVLRFVGESSFKYEETVVNHILEWKGTYWRERVEDVLFELVQTNKLEWFGAESEALCRPDRRPTKYQGMLKYRIKYKPK